MNNKIINETPKRPKSLYRFIMQIFVWILIVAFIVTAGTGLDLINVPIIAKSKSYEVDIAPNSLYVIERNKIDQRAREQFANVDPRVLNRYIDMTALTNTKILLGHAEFFKDIKLTPTTVSKMQAASSGVTGETFVVEYGRQSLFGSTGVLSVLANPSISDAYVYRDMKNFSLATEVISFNKTDFFLSKITDEERTAYFNENLDFWASIASVDEFTFEKRSEARRFVQAIKEKGLEVATNMLGTDYTATVATNVTITSAPETYNYFVDILKAYKDRKGTELVVSDPTYVNRMYKVAVLLNDFSYNQLDFQNQYAFARALVNDNYREFDKKFSTEWLATIKTVQDKLAADPSFSGAVTDVLGVSYAVTQEFTPVSLGVNTVQGAPLDIPFITDAGLFKTLLDTPLNEMSDLVYAKNSKDFAFIIRPLQKMSVANEEIPDLTPETQQELANYKFNQVSITFGVDLADRYNVKTYENVLTNFQQLN